MESLGMTSHTIASSLRAWCSASISDFLQSQPDAVLGRLTANCDFALIPTQRDAWMAQVQFLRSHLDGLSGSLFLEFTIPRMGRRIDAVLLIGPVVFAVEFKVGETTFDRAAHDQVWDYALDLKNFHEASHEVSIVPILVASEADAVLPNSLLSDKDKVYRPVSASPQTLRQIIDMA